MNSKIIMSLIHLNIEYMNLKMLHFMFHLYVQNTQITDLKILKMKSEKKTSSSTSEDTLSIY